MRERYSKRETERVRDRKRERERHETVKTWKWYDLHNMKSASFPINRRLHRERERARGREMEIESKKER